MNVQLNRRAALQAGAALAGASLLPAWAQTQEGVRDDVGKTSKWTKLVPAEQVEQAAATQYTQMTR